MKAIPCIVPHISTLLIKACLILAVFDSQKSSSSTWKLWKWEEKKCEIAVGNVFSFSLSWLSRCFWNVPTSAPIIRLNAAHLSQRAAESRELGNRKDWRLDIMGSDWSLEADVPLPGFHLPARGRGETRIQQQTEPRRLSSTAFK